jgi:hypothetical protein
MNANDPDIASDAAVTLAPGERHALTMLLQGTRA